MNGNRQFETKMTKQFINRAVTVADEIQTAFEMGVWDCAEANDTTYAHIIDVDFDAYLNTVNAVVGAFFRLAPYMLDASAYLDDAYYKGVCFAYDTINRE